MRRGNVGDGTEKLDLLAEDAGTRPVPSCKILDNFNSGHNLCWHR